MSAVNRALLDLYRLGVNQKQLRALSTVSAYRIHRYLLAVADVSPDTYTTINELSDLLKIPYKTVWRTVQSLTRHGLLDSKRGPPQRKYGNHGGGGKGKAAWRAKL